MLHISAYKYEKHKELFVNSIKQSKFLDSMSDQDEGNEWYFDLSVDPYVLIPRRCTYDD